DVVGLAQTGTGKTAAFGLPVLNQINTFEKKTQSLILAPTRELCVQIANDLKNYAKYQQGVKVVAVYGGENIVAQFKQLDIPPQVLVATPGRLIDLINRGKVDLSNIDFLVLDEADEMLNMGFLDDIETILQRTPETRRTMLFSATMPKEIANIAKRYMKDYEEIAVGKRNSGSDNVEHIYYLVQAKQRYLALKRIVDLNPDIYGIVFCRTRQETKEVAEHLMRDGYNADALHGDLSQVQRDSVMQKFRIRNLQLLVATDVAARGLDVSDLTHVINYNLPPDVESYTHRSGRTGRANKRGISVSIINLKERGKIKEIERIINKKFEQQPVPNGLEVCKKQLFYLVDKMENVQVNEEQIASYMPTIYRKLQEMSKEEVIKRFVSMEFNRFLDYYKDAVDLNAAAENVGKRRSGKADRIRFKFNMGEKHGFNFKRVLGIINDATNDKSINIGDIEITPKYSFFDIDADQAPKVIDAFDGRNDITLSVVENTREKSGNKSNKGGGNYSRDRKPERRSSDRDNKHRNDRNNRKSGGSANGKKSDKEYRNRGRRR
ncbi:MAG: DEAD/DEAH box helicase, partial [Prevotellaceae bacterium]|nr:DEAD/DEAH box helicase [Prevotellaceae bacterium]